MFKCKEGCSECCGCIPIPIEIFEKNRDKFQVIPKEIVRTQQGMTAITSDVFCIFLNRETNKCMIYDERPQVCRDYGEKDNPRLACVYFKPNGNPRSEAMQKRVQRYINHLVDRAIKVSENNPRFRFIKEDSKT
jgi:Fe-S-cluster containining protein